MILDVKQWELTEHDDFESKESLIGWSMNVTSACNHQPRNRFLGGHCILSSDEVSKSYQLPDHNTVRITANIHLFDKWEGENVYFKIDDQLVWFKSAKSSDNSHRVNVCGGESSDPKYNMFLSKSKLNIFFY